ncbi:Serine hydroxymethyltransferase 7 [Arabidopsis thaliana]|jgi:glycine hydroxymethyltransferase|uniref:Serine hydroxymethyltransferase 7 n=4 Tax=Arabidopsis TaxID=3701 RepID=GLYC7_ARATH|nr:serine hydroxymethyltransferase 7 [Arabidopsis thaliana]Q84WV0.1 RecName: Full=Serine hydroxymethyltransferase 7; Short=AtSHMT7; AltName: Full=Glycine hydroxymethyltransferase 7; AltName: Full=Serine methylase 7 [Arabidopsis thaliana]KAG7648588.1 Serine hydroxymethyltransferase-like domain [Arabidopsis thaliana x Arabidopsis arenosa]AAO22567.1 putative hydroxymethyltransferase [Arabidopsis thaliana]AEE31862.1 serine hydroxymethyltransferase 7 [Arabidopsis thaliana]OAP19468.1 SHM7 [Arabidops|eukprot:NP_564473.1 serine hydroxymethyltransferase 7 [Arabidopsis thaliana]
MDLSRSQTNFQLGFGCSHASMTPTPTPRAPIADDSINLQVDQSFRSLPTTFSPIPLQLLEQKAEKTTTVDEPKKDGGGGGDQKEDEHFRILGHHMCLKRQRDCPLLLTQSKHPKRSSIGDSDLESRRAAVRAWGDQPIHLADPDIHELMEKEKQRQVRGIELIASENFVCRAVMEALGSHLTNKYSEGMPGARYYTGNQYIDQIENLCIERALTAFGLESDKWGVNVQPYSCTSANFAVYTGLLLPGERIMGLDSPSGGHMSHGYCTPGGKKISAASIFFESFPYKVNPQTGYIDYDKLEDKALDYRPKILICGGSSYPRDWDFARVRQIADKCGAVLMCDMAHISGLVATKECSNPFDHCDIVTSTTHKGLRGPRGGIIFYRRGPKIRKQGHHSSHCDTSTHYDLEEKINFAVFPSLQGGPHNNHIAALAIALKQVATPEYKAYIQQMKKNAQALAAALLRRKCRLVTGGTDNHLLLWDLTPMGLTGKVYEKVCEMCHITLNKTAIFGDNGTISPGGVRIGTPAMTTRGCIESDFETMADFLIKAAQITSALQREHGKSHKEFVKSLCTNKDIAELRNRVEAFALQYEMPASLIRIE